MTSTCDHWVDDGGRCFWCSAPKIDHRWQMCDHCGGGKVIDLATGRAPGRRPRGKIDLCPHCLAQGRTENPAHRARYS